MLAVDWSLVGISVPLPSSFVMFPTLEFSANDYEAVRLRRVWNKSTYCILSYISSNCEPEPA